MTLSTVARVIRMICDEATMTRVRVGIASARTSFQPVSFPLMYAVAGSHPRCTATTSTRNVATRNSGTEMRLRVPKVTARSSLEPGYIAASSPRVIETGIAMTATTLARRRVLRRRGTSISEIGVPMVPKPEPALEIPRSPVRKSPSQMK